MYGPALSGNRWIPQCSRHFLHICVSRSVVASSEQRHRNFAQKNASRVCVTKLQKGIGHMALWSFLYSCSWSLCWIVRPGPRQTTTEWPCSLSLGPIRPVFFCKMFMNMFSLCLPKLTFKMNQQMPKNEARNFTQNPHIPRHDINSNKMWLKPLPY